MDQIREQVEKFKQKQKGFTLVELIVVIAIIGILAGVMLPKYFEFTNDARQAAAISEAKSVRTIAETYFANKGEWPQPEDDDASTINGTTFTGATIGALDINGEFTYTAKNGMYAHCDTDGHVFASNEDGTAIE